MGTALRTPPSPAAAAELAGTLAAAARQLPTWGSAAPSAKHPRSCPQPPPQPRPVSRRLLALQPPGEGGTRWMTQPSRPRVPQGPRAPASPGSGRRQSQESHHRSRGPRAAAPLRTPGTPLLSELPPGGEAEPSERRVWRQAGPRARTSPSHARWPRAAPLSPAQTPLFPELPVSPEAGRRPSLAPGPAREIQKPLAGAQAAAPPPPAGTSPTRPVLAGHWCLQPERTLAGGAPFCLSTGGPQAAPDPPQRQQETLDPVAGKRLLPLQKCRLGGRWPACAVAQAGPPGLPCPPHTPPLQGSHPVFQLPAASVSPPPAFAAGPPNCLFNFFWSTEPSAALAVGQPLDRLGCGPAFPRAAARCAPAQHRAPHGLSKPPDATEPPQQGAPRPPGSGPRNRAETPEPAPSAAGRPPELRTYRPRSSLFMDITQEGLFASHSLTEERELAADPLDRVVEEDPQRDGPAWEKELVSKIRAMSSLEQSLLLERVQNCIKEHSQLTWKVQGLDASVQVLLARLGLDPAVPWDKTSLFRLYGLALRECPNVNLVRRHLSVLLDLSHQLSEQREGVALTVGLTSTLHLEEVWALLEHLGRTRFLRSAAVSSQSQQLEVDVHWRWVGSTCLLCYGQMAAHIGERLLPWVDNIACRMVYYFSCSSYDHILKMSFLCAAIMLTKALKREGEAESFKFTQIPELIQCLLCILQKEPGYLATLLRQKIILVITGLSSLRPRLKPTVKSRVLQTCLWSLYTLPAPEMLKGSLPPMAVVPDVMVSARGAALRAGGAEGPAAARGLL
ncbi:proline-rich protein 36-like [Talpa occidentalis]|uniref:proline-rich protein 36-like n=1 Tax=Talpa occidentalis TaxID=50954 RepID=UPI00188E35BA|nr:proline-rich protein 36-like [Talpa occidentalis]